MQIRTRLTWQFVTLGAIILLLSFTAIFFLQSGYRKDDFYNRLQNKAINTAKLLIEVEEVDVSLLRRIDKDNPMSLPRERIIILDHTDTVIYSTDDEGFIAPDGKLLDEIKANEQIRYRKGNFEVLGMVYLDKEEQFVIIAAATDIYGLKKTKNLLNILVIVSISSLAFLLAAGWFFSGRALQPINRVIMQVDDISISSLDLRVDEGNGQDEIAKLAQTFNKMLERLETAFKMQKNFINNASHELRTPLTAISGQLEVLLMKKRSTAEYEQALSSILEDMKSLNLISNRLLLLAQASTERSQESFAPVRLDDILWQAKEELTKRNKEYTIHIEIDPLIDDESKLTIKGDEQLIKTAILNLMENGCKYSGDKKVSVGLKTTDESIRVRFTDHGYGIPEEDIGLIFEPFLRGRNVQHIKGHGIGLSLVERVIKMHNGTIGIESTLNKGSVFTIELPLFS